MSIFNSIYMILLLFGLINSPNNNLHDFHTSLSEIKYNPKEKSLEISIRVFTDDFEKALTQLNNGQKVPINSNDTKSDAIIEKYLLRHFALISPAKQLKSFNYIGKELEGDATWIYLEIPNSQTLTEYIFLNDILLEQFADQTNLVNIFYPNQKKTIIFSSKNKTDIWPF